MRANADTPDDAKGGHAISVPPASACAAPSMFFEGDRIKAVREMILADDEAGRPGTGQAAADAARRLRGLFREMSGLPVTIRLLDPPLHEFVPARRGKPADHGRRDRMYRWARSKMRVDDLHEFNPMMGHRGCRLGITTEITEMQARAILEAGLNMKARVFDVKAKSWSRWWERSVNSTPNAKVIRQTGGGLRRRGEKLDFRSAR